VAVAVVMPAASRAVLVVVALVVMMRMMSMVMRVVVVCVIVTCMRVTVSKLWSRLVFLPCGNQRTAFHPEKPRSEQCDQAVADDLDPPHGAVHGAPRGTEQRRGHAHDRHGHQRLQQRGREGQHNTAPPGLAVGDHVRGDHRLAVTGAGGMKHAIGEGQGEQAPDRTAILLGGPYRPRQSAIEFGLLGEQPADDAVGRRRGRARRAERAALRKGRVAPQRHRKRHGGRSAEEQNDMSGRPPARQHFTPILLANCAPNGLFGSGRAKIDSLSDLVRVSSPSFTVEILQEAGAPFRVIGSFSANSKATK
jgi:hypothetical protein